MDFIICRRQMSSLYVIQVECSILRINHLFQNGRALLKCRIFILLHAHILLLYARFSTYSDDLYTHNCKENYFMILKLHVMQ